MQKITRCRIPYGSVFLLLLTGALAAPTLATSVPQLSDAELTSQASLIVVGRCHRAAAEWHGRALVTHAEIEIETTLKGAAEESVSVYLPGGIDLNRAVPITVTVPGAPTLAAGDRVLLFLIPIDGHEGFAIAGFNQGKRGVSSAASGASLVEIAGAKIPLDDAKSWIHEQMQKAGDDDAR